MSITWKNVLESFAIKAEDVELDSESSLSELTDIGSSSGDATNITSTFDLEGTTDVKFPPSTRRQKVSPPVVVVPTFASLKRNWTLAKKEEDMKTNMEIKLNPKVKIKVKDDGFKLETVRARLDKLGIKSLEIDLPGELRYPELIPRQFFSDTYGGNPQQTFPTIHPDRVKKHGYENFMYLNLDYNPMAPMFPGSSGLFFTSTVLGDVSAAWLNKEFKVITRLQRSAWEYEGDYQVIGSEPLTKEEWSSQTRNVRDTWTAKICEQRWGRWVRARVFLRKELHREPTQMEVDEALDTRKDLFKGAVSPADVMLAYNRGEENIGVWCMKCIGYDEEFQRQTLGKFATWVPAKPKTGKKRKRNVEHEDSE